MYLHLDENKNENKRKNDHRTEKKIEMKDNKQKQNMVISHTIHRIR